jgi:histone-binding protein RBBP4
MRPQNKNRTFYGLHFPFEGVLPHLTIQFLSTKIYENDYSSQKIIIGEQRQTNINVNTPHLLIGNLNLRTKTNEKNHRFSSTRGSLNIEVSIPHEGDVNKARCCPQKNQIIATKTSHGDVLLFDYTWHSSQSPKQHLCLPQLRLKGHKQSEGYGLSWNLHHEGLLLSSSYDNSICIWDISNGGCKNTVEAYTHIVEKSDLIEDVSWLPFHKNIFGLVGTRGKLVFYDTRLQKDISRQNLSSNDAYSLSCSLHSDFLLALGLSDGCISMMDMRQLRNPLFTLRGHDGPLKKAPNCTNCLGFVVLKIHFLLKVSFSPYRRELLASSGGDGSLCVWNVDLIQKQQISTQSKLHFVQAGHTTINDFSWNPMDMKVIAIAGQYTSSIWSTEL